MSLHVKAIFLYNISPITYNDAMEKITISELESFHGLKAELDSLIKEREFIYYPIFSPNGKKNPGVYNSSPSDPTAESFRKLQALDERISDRIETISDTLTRIEDFLDTIPDEYAHIRAGIRWHYIMGLDWGKTNLKVYGYHNYHVIRKAVLRYLGVEK